MNYSLFRSKTFWTLIAMFAVGGGNAVIHVLPPNIQAIVMAILTLMASYFHLSTGNSTTGAN